MALVLFLFIFNINNILSQNWNNDCEYDECYENNNIPWTTKQSPMIYYQGPESPNCWIQVDYRIREAGILCQTDCELEILGVLVSGDCFYSYQEPFPPYYTHPPLMDMTSLQDMWNKSVELFLASQIEPCFIPPGVGPNNCQYIPRVNSAVCKKVVNNPDGTRLITYCENFNSCCTVEAIICKNQNGSIVAAWHKPDEVPDNCHLNNDPSCKLSCESYNWYAPKINFNETNEKLEDIFIRNSLSNIEIDCNNLNVNMKMINILGKEIIEQNSSNFIRIEKSNLSKGAYFIILEYNGKIKNIKVFID